MIQRIQTAYLGVAAVLLIVAAASLNRTDASEEPLLMAAMLMTAVLSVVALVAVFLYNDRRKQAMVTHWSRIGAMLVLMGIALYFGTGPTEAASQDSVSIEVQPILIASLAVAVAMALLFLALAAIRKDIELVESMDRIR